MASEKDTSGAPDKLLVREVSIEARSFGVKFEDTENVLDVVRAMGEEINRLRPLAALGDEGKVLRAQLIDETIAEGVRALGDKFEEEKKREMLGGLPVDVVTEMRSTWKAIGDANFAGAKTRQSADDPDNPDEPGDDEKEETPEEPTPVFEDDDDSFGGA